MNNQKQQSLKTILTIVVALIIVHLYYHTKWPIYIALALGLAGVFSQFLSLKIHFLWMKLSWILSLIIPKILLTAIFYLILFPIAILSRLFGKKDELNLKPGKESMFKSVSKNYTARSFEDPW